ncbi:hydroxymethylpyrimidine/phosphomethylpyrimidine kinase [Edaphobacter acidisoli]|uniref:hydroxymethylpyrimidine kinase n=1 Tax=Edaphobacter acidisoli TaxID=2040573 RepID=A0A916W2S6_9BACT|nr:bifunctional hydroxymethylpyrimidine kinase/phosphomethylpyrimidine kinase [Edaphobacter acidisoli]GGA61506.1 hydroxymethylpyrimidine/phosphomethylpyrimidine kinase [Edaphobacter acidisoli]
MKTVLTIAGFDPSSGAGITADLMVFRAHGLFGTSCITGLTVQSTVGVRGMHPVKAEVVRETLDCLWDDLPAAGIKIGMLATAANVVAVADFLERVRRTGVAVVLDPVLRSSSGRELLEADGVALMRERLLPLVDWVTPNLDELAMLSGRRVAERDDVPEAARALQRAVRGLSVMATGGHLAVPDDFVMTADGRMRWLSGEHVETSSTHGTGCALSSALLCGLVRGDADAPRSAKEYVTGALRAAHAMGKGRGPVEHLWQMRWDD